MQNYGEVSTPFLYLYARVWRSRDSAYILVAKGPVNSYFQAQWSCFSVHRTHSNEMTIYRISYHREKGLKEWQSFVACIPSYQWDPNDNFISTYTIYRVCHISSGLFILSGITPSLDVGVSKSFALHVYNEVELAVLQCLLVIIIRLSFPNPFTEC